MLHGGLPILIFSCNNLSSILSSDLHTKKSLKNSLNLLLQIYMQTKLHFD